jgi:hypothetical protein
MRTAAQSQPGQIVHETLSQKKTLHKKKKIDGVCQDVGPEEKKYWFLFSLIHHTRDGTRASASAPTGLYNPAKASWFLRQT